jgi:hypothetical protein
VRLVGVLEARQEGQALLTHHTRHMRLHTIRLQGSHIQKTSKHSDMPSDFKYEKNWDTTGATYVSTPSASKEGVQISKHLHAFRRAYGAR